MGSGEDARFAMTSDRFNELKKALEPSGIELAASDLSKQVSTLAEAAKAADESSIARLAAALGPSMQISDSVAEMAKAADGNSIARLVADLAPSTQISDSVAEMIKAADENSIARLVAHLRPSTQISDSVAEMIKATEATSMSLAVADLGSVARLSDSLAARASIESLQLDRSRELAQELSQQLALSQSALREAASAPVLQLQESFAAFGAERASFLETIRHQIVESQTSLQAALSAPVVEMERQMRESLRQLTAPTFRLPRLEESRALTAQMFEAYSLPKIHMEDAFRTLADGMKGMTTPWLDIQHELQSTKAFTALQDLGHVLNAGPSYDDRTSDLVRVALGNWQVKITLPDSVAEMETRAALYRDRGVDAELTQFSASAFDQAISIARIKRPPPGLIITFRSPTLATSAEEEEGHALRNLAHDYLQQLESQIRQFIEMRMTAAYGANWAKQRLSAQMLSDWVEKRERHLDYGGADFPLIAFADFTHYEPIIVRKDHWKAAFAGTFGKKESVIESLQRLYPIRLATMHARPVGQEDLLLLYVEVQRLCRAMGKKPG
jgi:Swt1-like HEPN